MEFLEKISFIYYLNNFLVKKLLCKITKNWLPCQKYSVQADAQQTIEEYLRQEQSQDHQKKKRNDLEWHAFRWTKMPLSAV